MQASFRFRVPAPEEQVTLATLQRMYRHFYIRLTDLVNLTGLVRAGRLDFMRLRNSTQRWSIWPGVATLLKITSDYNERTGAGPLPLPEFVVSSARFGAEVTYVGEQFLRVPMLPQGSQLVSAATHRNRSGAPVSRRGSLVSIAGAGCRCIRQSPAYGRRQGDLVARVSANLDATSLPKLLSERSEAFSLLEAGLPHTASTGYSDDLPVARVANGAVCRRNHNCTVAEIQVAN